MRTCFNKSTLATCRCAGFDRSKESCVFIRPHDHASTVAALCCIGCDARVITNESSTRLRSIRRVTAEIVATDANAAAASCAVCIYECIAKESDAVAEDVDRSTLTRCAGCINCSVDCNDSIFSTACCNALADDRSRKIHRKCVEIATRHRNAALPCVDCACVADCSLRSCAGAISSKLRTTDCDHDWASSLLDHH